MKELKFTVECPNKLEGKNTIKESLITVAERRERKKEKD